MLPITRRFEDAVSCACELHGEQTRKGGAIPYVAHLFGVAAIAMEHGADEDEAIAALLHDAVEDQGGVATLEQIRRRFGERVASIVEACTDAWTDPKPPWRQRKQAYLEHLPQASASARLVSAADKLHNARAILSDQLAHGDAVFERFNGGKTGTLWYYRSLAEIFSHAGPHRLADELERVVSQIEHLAAEPDAEPRARQSP